MSNYTELKDSIIELFEQVKDRDYNGSIIKTAGRCFYEYEMTMDEGESERIICPIIIGILIVRSSNRIFIGQHKLILEAANEALSIKNELNLSKEEYNEVIEWARELLEKLPNMVIEHGPYAK